MKTTQQRTHHRAVGILARTALFSWLVAIVTLGTFIAVVVPGQRAAFLENLASKAHGVAASLQDIAAGAAISEDYSAIVDHCTRILAEDSSIEYLVLTRMDGFSLVHERAGWRSEILAGPWLPEERVAGGMIRRVENAKGEVYHYSRPFDYSGIQWGWIHVGLSLQSYRENVEALYHRTILAVVICLVIGLFVSFLYARQLTRPIMQLRAAVVKLTDGDLSVRARVASRDEVGELGASFNRMTESLLQRDKVVQSVRFAAQQFLSADDWRQVINGVLDNLGRAADASRVQLFENRRDEGQPVTTGLRGEWTAAHARPLIDVPAMRNLPIAAMDPGGMVSTLEKGRPFLAVFDDLTADGREILGRHGIQSLAAVRVSVGGSWWGMISLVDCRDHRKWSEAEVAGLRAVAHTLGAAIERDEARKALVLAKEVAEAASEAKSQFLANMSHEIRTPITGVIGMLHLLQRTALNAKQERYVGNAVTAAGTLLTVIGDVLDFSKIEAGRLELEESTFSIPDMLDTAVRVFAEKAETRGIELSYRLEDSVPRQLSGDPDRLRQILVNLIGNALKFTERGEVTVTCRLQEELPGAVIARFSVRDTGCGIARQQQEMIFEAFSQADNSMSRLHGGTGLGLAICRQLCELMGGSIGVESEPGCGSTFWFTARLGRAEPAMMSPAPAPCGLKGLRVLIVDDCATTLGIVSEYVRSWKGVAAVASDAALGLEALREAVRAEAPFQVAILDWRMPGIDGFTMARLIKEDPALRSTGLVLLSSFGHMHDEAEGSGSPFAAAVPKPARMSELYDAVVTAANGDLTPLRKPKPAPTPVPPESARPRRGGVVLLVEDNEINREVASEMITELGFTCLHAANGREAVAAVQARQADLVLMDCQMPVMDGYEATGVIRQWERTEGDPTRRHRLPIIALTAHAMKGDRDVCLQAGMDDFLTKPVDPDELAKMLTKWMSALEGERAPVTAENADPAAPPVPADPLAGEAAGQLPVPGPSPIAPTSDPIDFPSLMQRCMGKPDLAERVVKMFVGLVRSYAEDIELAVAAQDAAALKQSAHRMKGSAANVSAQALSQLAAELEILGAENNLSPAPALVGQLREEVEQLVQIHGDTDRRAA